MKTFDTGFFRRYLFRSFFLAASIAAGAISSQNASAAIQGEAAYTQGFAVPAFVPDVRALIVNAARARGWQLIDDKPGELTFELQHAKSHMAVVVKSNYSKSELSLRKVSAKTFDCTPGIGCEVKADVVQRWMISLRREVGVALLRLAIQDSGAGDKLPPERAPVAEAE